MISHDGEGRTPGTGRMARAIAVGVFFWLVAALTVRFGVPAGLFAGTTWLVMYGAVPPATWGAIWLLGGGASGRRAAVADVVSVATAAAAFCDVAALVWAPRLYAVEPRDVLTGVTWILWGVACALALAQAVARERQGVLS